VTNVGKPFYWPVSCATTTVFLNGFTNMTPGEVAKSVAAAAHTWSPGAVTCADGTHPYFEVAPAMAEPGAALPPAAYDARNSIIFRTERWSMSASPDPRKAYDPQALAITSVFAKPDGHIVDADIEINAVGPEWANLDPDGTGGLGHGLEANDLQTALTHEFGHFIGLDHTCYTPSLDLANPTQRPKDDMGNDVPDCFDAPDAIRQTVMFNSVNSGDISKRTLTSDENRAACAIYPAAWDPHACVLDRPNDSMGCAVEPGPAGGRGRPALVAVALALSLVAVAARGRRA
jgi:hypothetical protein